MTTRKELDTIATSIADTLGGLVGHGYIRQCRAVGAGQDLRVSITLDPPAAIRLARILAEKGLAVIGGDPLAKVRVRITDRLGNVNFIFRDGAGEWRCVSSTSIPLAFSYAGIRYEMECKFALADCTTVDEVLAVLRRFSSYTVSLLGGE